MQRGLVPLAIMIVLAAGCARPGTADSADEVAPPTAAQPTPSRFVAACADPAASPAPGSAAPPAATPNPSGFEERSLQNRAFRNRNPLPLQAMAAVQPCVEKVRAGLARLRAEGRFDGPSIEGVLTGAGLVDVESRKPGRLDTAGGGGLLFCGNSGFGYVFGEHGQALTRVEAGGGIADGGCLPAPD
ncbi:hypothetical protein AB0K00_32170 [Dactylosporangium sp. NPDC049525]|uniref:hypothetical protein n=1 Tax=Dactylosporangium sp. NPDC049525 TaxID=3154730 RepID=UPI00344180AB